VSVAPSTAGSTGFPAWRRAAYLPHRRQAAATSSPTPPPISFDDAGDEPSAPRPAFRLVLPRDKRDRLAERTAALAQRRRCGVAGCGADGLPVLLVETEQEALLCPVHQLVAPDGAPIAGQPMLATAAW